MSKRLDRATLHKIYVSYIRPVLEHGAIIWCNCTHNQSTKLEETALKAGRAICGAKKGTSHRLLYEELGWEKLKERRERQCLIMMYKMISNQTSSTLCDLVPARTHERTDHDLRNSDRITPPRSNSTQHFNSFLPATIRSWNELPPEIRQATSLEDFKHNLRNILPKSPKFYEVGSRKGQILHCRLRVKNSDLRSHLYQINLSETYICECGEDSETVDHFLTECTRYDDQRETMRQELADLLPLSSEDLLKGSQILSETQNSKNFNSVQKYIIDSHRFT